MDFQPLLSQVIASAEDLDDPGELAHALLQAAYSGGIGVFVWEPLAGRLLWNDAMYEVYGLDRNQFAGTVKDWLSVVHPDDLAKVNEEVAAALKGVRPYDVVFRVCLPNGDLRYVQGTAWVERDLAGRPLRMAGINQDVTDRYRFQMLVEAIQSGTGHEVGRSFFQSLSQSLARALQVRYVYITELQPHQDPTHLRVVAANRSEHIRFDHDYPLVNSPTLELLHSDEMLCVEDLMQRYPGDGSLREVGAVSYLGVALHAVDGRVIGTIALLDDKPLRDIELARKLLRLFAGRAAAELQRYQHEDEERRQKALLEALVTARTEEVRRTMRELEAFTYSVSHDLSTPLRAILGFGGVLRDDFAQQLDPHGQDYLERTLGAADKMRQLLEDLVNLSKISLRPITLTRVDLAPVAQAIVDNLQNKRPRPEVQVRIADSLIMHADAGLMRLVLDSLIRNAWEFTRGIAEPQIEIGETSRDGQRMFYVRDNGVGFDAKQTEQLFLPFRGGNGDDPTSDTRGRGLSMTQRILHRHHGGVVAESQPGAGATFYFWTPPASELAALVAKDTL